MNNIKYDNWLSDQIGYDAYSVNINSELIELTGDSSTPEHLWFHEIKTKKCFAFTKIDPFHISQIQFVEKHGFNLIDTNLLFKKENLTNTTTALKYNDYTLCYADPTDAVSTALVAENNFVFSRFHLDPFFNNTLANKIKAGWVTNYFNGTRGDKMIIAKKNKTIAGFLQLFINPDHLIIDLIAVDKEHRKTGLAKQMIEFATASAKKCKYIIVGTQLANLPSINLYQKLGFKLISGKYVFHYHN